MSTLSDEKSSHHTQPPLRFQPWKAPLWKAPRGPEELTKASGSINGSALNYPTITVAHEETADFGRNWRITYPMDIRNCESCHSASGTSGTWKNNPNRLACMGCHDSDAATAHMSLQTYDPTPNAPFSGDERESCKSCH